MAARNRIRTVLTLSSMVILALAVVQVQAGTVEVPNGNFQLYKPGTG